MSVDNSQLRLSKDFIPSNYEIFLDIDIINLEYKSKVSIDITSQIENPKYLSLNSKFLSKESKIYNFKLIPFPENNNDKNYIISQLDRCPIDYTKTISSIYFKLKPGIKKGQKLNFKCEKKDKIKTSQEGYGLFACFWDHKLRKLLDEDEFDVNKYINNFKDKNNPTIEEIKQNVNYFNSLVISLNSSPIALREIIPCFDEPCFKSTFNLIISVNKIIANSSKYFTIVSNGDLDKVIEKGNKSIYYFKSTPRMSSYLLTFTIGFYEYNEKYINKKNGNKIRLRIYTPLNQLKDNKEYLSLTEDALKRYEKMFDYSYDMDKLDSIIIPNLNFTAMEFFGCITYRQFLMIDNKNTNSSSYRYIIKDVYHEVFHNWIGNLTTMEFFDNTWLNEGLTKFMELYIGNNFGKAYFDDLMIYAYYYTLSDYSHAINNKLIDSEEAIRDNFDNITYEKGSYVIYMLVTFFGEDKVFLGLKFFFEKFKYNNANEKDFFDCMSKACDFDIKYLLSEWIYEKSFPILNVSFSEKKDEIILEQQPCFGKKSVIFKIPVFIKTKNLDKNFLMKGKKITLKLDDLNITYEDINLKNNFIVINSDIKCFCIANYLDEILKDAIFYFYNEKEKRISDADIYQILISYKIFEFHGYAFKDNNIRKYISKLKSINNFAILNFIISYFTLPKLYINKFFYDESNKKNKELKKLNNEILYGLIDHNNSLLIDKILNKFDKINDDKNEVNNGQIDYEKYFILIICLYKRDENIIKKILKIFKENQFNFDKINVHFRSILSLIINEFMYLIEENDKIKAYKSMFNYYEEMHCYWLYPESNDFEKSLNNLNNGFSFEILDFYFENKDVKDIQSIDDIIVDYFFNYLIQLNNKNNNGGDLFNYLYEIGVSQNFDINDENLNKIYKAYLKFVENDNLDRQKLRNYIDENYLDLKNINGKDKINKLKEKLNINY